MCVQWIILKEILYVWCETLTVAQGRKNEKVLCCVQPHHTFLYECENEHTEEPVMKHSSCCLDLILSIMLCCKSRVKCTTVGKSFFSKLVYIFFSCYTVKIKKIHQGVSKGITVASQQQNSLYVEFACSQCLCGFSQGSVPPHSPQTMQDISSLVYICI